MNKTTIPLTIKTKTPLHISCTRKSLINIETLQVVDDYGQVGKNFTIGKATEKMTMVSHTEGEQKTFRVGYIKSNGLRGHLRDICAQKLLHALQDNGEPRPDPDTYRMITSGAVTGKPLADGSFEECDRAAKNPFMGVFGGGPNLLRSHYRIMSAIPVCYETVAGGYIEGMTESQAAGLPTAREILQGVTCRRIDDTLYIANITDGGQIDQFPESLKSWIEELGKAKTAKTEERAAKAEERTARKNGQAPKKVKVEKTESSGISVDNWRGTEVIIPGVTFKSQVDFYHNGAPLSGLGLLILGIAELNHCQHGGEVRNGYGWLEIQGTIGGEPLLKDGAPNLENPLVAEAITAWEEEKKTLKTADLKAFARRDKKGEEE